MLKLTKLKDIKENVKDDNIKNYIIEKFNQVYNSNINTMFENVDINDADLEEIGGFIFIENQEDFDEFFSDKWADIYSNNFFPEWVDVTDELIDLCWLENDEIGYNLFIVKSGLNETTLNKLIEISADY